MACAAAADAFSSYLIDLLCVSACFPFVLPQDKHVGGGGAAAAAAAARKRPMDPAEAAALARREAARKRVEERTKTSFGLT